MARIVYLLIGIILFQLVGCKKYDDCKRTYTKIEVRDSKGEWFNGITKTENLYLHSNKGRSESMEVKYTDDVLTLHEEECSSLQGEIRNVRYASSLYGKRYNCRIVQKEHSSYIKVSKSGELYDNELRCEIDPNQKTAYKCVHYSIDYDIGGSIIQTNRPLEMIDSLVVNGKLFRNTYKVDFESTRYSFDGKTKVIYLNPQYGIVKFENFDGEEWTLF